MLKLSDNELRWYVANTCRQEKKIKQRLNTMGIENFIPFQQIARKIHGVDKLIEVPVIPNLVFIHTTLKTCMSLIQDYAFDMRYLRDRETGNFLIVPDKQMNDFMFLLDFSKEMVEVVNENLKKGDKVRVIKGDFAGIEGELVRVKGHKRVVVRLEGVVSLATAYIPGSFLEKIE
ncbi:MULTISPECIES: UpxY family transcription antiterminator [Odoribacteraceae]|uniref:UpxY family transcription antiterminator n=1 Tax=Odoribacteraceae TaxID=1853231 RepID=UPI000E500149|nr:MULTISPECIES: UpxY family transcription antiterminator [Odoribacteraceae]MCQ4873457.1 UpxY family transcription antiterminator [Butyricimonas paravirosa]RHR79166.1 UpxY family transcription antiterminator [Odoribacter sp. AF15-53]